MILFPAIDLKDGQCVRLKLGEMDSATVYNEDPAAQARAFEDQGFEWLHVVDLNGAFEGQSVNGAAVEAILKATKNPVQLGGGIRTLAHIESWLDKGLARVILGTIAVRDPDLVREACKRFPGRVAVGIDAKGGKVAVEGWAEASELGVIELAKRFEGAGVAAIIYTDIDRDGVLTGINWESDHRTRRSRLDPGDRLGWSGLDCRHRPHENARCGKTRRRDLRPRALRRAHRSGGGAGCSQRNADR
jgi:phosphoribosylformimino-5-aminoimidazole carboxamide ribotide isomerase